MASISHVDILDKFGDVMSHITGGNKLQDAMLDIADYMSAAPEYRDQFPVRVVVVDSDGRETTVCEVTLR